MSEKNRKIYADKIVEKLCEKKEALKKEFLVSSRIRSFVLDDLLPKEWCREIYESFPKKEEMVLRNTLREKKYIAAQMNQHNPLLEEIVYAFQDERVLKIVEEITGITPLLPDEKLYAGGVSLMAPGNFLNLHLDNSHDLNRENYRVLNLLYYVSPDWKEEDGGNLELWDEGPRKSSRVIASQANRLVVMVTGKKSWHSVSPVTGVGNRCCVSNYYFSPNSVEAQDYFHVTSFRARPEQGLSDLILRVDNTIRMGLRKIFKMGIVKTKHVYKK